MLQAEDAEPVVNAFEDDFSQTVMFEADFSQANFHPTVTAADIAQDTGSTPTPAAVEESNNIDTQAKAVTDEKTNVTKKEEFKVPPIPNIKNKVGCLFI